MKVRITSAIALAIGLLLSTARVQAQNSYQLLPESTMQITGTSTIHDWECDVEEMNLNTNLRDSITEGILPSTPEFINSLTLTVPVREIESGKGGMNRKIYGALKEDDHPTIQYRYSGGEIVSSDTTSGTFTINATGDLTIAGVTKEVTFPVEGSFSDAGDLRFTGSYSLNMKDYDMDPPTAVFGTIRAGEEVTISFNVLLGREEVANK